MSTDAELHRLRELVGPSEVDYRQLRADLDAATAATEEAVLEAGRLRGQLTEMAVQLDRARRYEDAARRRPDAGPISVLPYLAGDYWSVALRPALVRTARRLGVLRPR
jgi:hypothetical protein